MIVLDLSILNQKGTPMFNSDTFANRPTFGIVGRIFISTDTKEFYRDTGTSWELIGGPGSGTITGSGAATQVAFWNGTSTISGSNNLYWDSTNNNLGINTNTPGNSLDVHGGTISTLGAFNQTTATNNTLLAFLNTDIPLWRIGNFYTGGANDFSVFDVIGNLQQFTIVNTTGQTFVGAKTTAAGRLVVNSATADAHLQIVGANAPSIRIDNAGSGGTQRFVFGLATATNNFIQGATAGEFCISTQSAGNMLFGMWQTINATEAMRISTANNLIVGSSVDNGNRLQITGNANFTGNLGIGTINSAWGSNWRALEFFNGVYLTALSTSTVPIMILGTNAYFDNTNFIYKNTAAATRYQQDSGTHYWYNAISGTAGNTISFIQAMTLSSSGNLQIGASAPLIYDSKLQVTGDAYITGVFRETITTNTQTASYSLLLADNGKLILMNVATANNLTIPLNSSINFPVGTKIDVSSIGAGQTTIVATGGVTINSAGGALKLRLQYSGATLVQTATDVWSLFGDITT